MLSKAFIESLSTPEEVDEQLRARHKAVLNCTGQLFRSVLGYEINQLLDRRNELQPVAAAC